MKVLIIRYEDYEKEMEEWAKYDDSFVKMSFDMYINDCIIENEGYILVNAKPYMEKDILLTVKNKKQ